MAVSASWGFRSHLLFTDASLFPSRCYRLQTLHSPPLTSASPSLICSPEPQLFYVSDPSQASSSFHFRSRELHSCVMRDFGTCFSQQTIKASDAACSGSNGVHSTQNVVSYLYKTHLSTRRELLIILTWWKNHLGQTLCVNVAGAGDGENPSRIYKEMDANSSPLPNKKGTKAFNSAGSRIRVHWDISSARFQSGPEPLDGYYVAVVVDSELGLLVGDISAAAAAKKFNTCSQVADFRQLARKEHVLGSTTYSTKARFSDRGSDHDVLIKCRGEDGGGKDTQLWVSVDGKKVINVKNLRWNFRGNQTLFIDGLAVDVMWNVHGWFFRSTPPSCAVFIFRARSGLDSRLWLEEEKGGFSLVICACKSGNLFHV